MSVPYMIRTTSIGLHHVSSNQSALRCSLKAPAALHRFPFVGRRCAHIL